ncbi:invasion associated locus B family protein [Saccharibacter sp. 17.LH.SD]|uniref:invasion associated locus B family protein n=1 Tax=Saccharibacter sp. 17.LH.SD TaxID=2689393 RepID=UPI00136FCFB6|nr:invasion associated locus B family protein [Saccharibacter sp. 17.LH.SD]MXV43888.1 invasion associated locus B family protein [Saccharibacter sp. 17.LH.SD]
MKRLKKAMGYIGLVCAVGCAGQGSSFAPSAFAAHRNAQHHPQKNASSLNETYQDWRVVCQTSSPSAGRRCEIVQQILSNQTHQRVLSVELMSVNGQLSGVVMAPLGVALTKGIALQADNTVVSGPLAFTACTSGGCMASLGFTQPQMTSLQSAHAVSFLMGTVGGQQLVVPISNKGLRDAVNRLNALVHS